jgi:diguanylate cyclase (GGDEF)-like protein/PAS domain S-box-containing protein
MTFTIKRKLVLLLLASVSLVLVLVGLAFHQLIHEFHEAQAHHRFTELFRDIGVQIEQSEAKLIRTVEALAKRDGVVSSINMIHHYARPESYEGLIYDVEKQGLTRALANQAHTGGIGQLVAYDGTGTLIAFHREQEPALSGYVSYENGAPAVMASVLGAPWSEANLPEMVDMKRTLGQERSYASVYRRCSTGFVIEVTAPVLREFPDGSTEMVGFLLGSQFIHDDFIAEVTRRSGIDLAMVFQDGARIGGLRNVSGLPSQASARLDGARAGAHTHPAHEEYFLSAAGVPLADGQHAIIVGGIPLEILEQEIERTQRVMLIILVLSAAVIIPTGAYTARKLIGEPVDRLLASVEAFGCGEFARRVDVHSNDELGRLAFTFNTMAEAIAQRHLAMVESEDKYRNLFENLPQRIFYKDSSLVYVSVNQRMAEDLGIRAEDAIGKTDEDLFPASLAAEYRESDRRVLDSGHIVEREEHYNVDGEERFIHTVKKPLFDAQGEVVGVLGIFWDVTERRQAEEQLRQSAVVFESTAEGVMITDANKNIIAVNKAFTEITGFESEEAIGQTPSILGSERQDAAFFSAMWKDITRNGRWQGEIWNRRKSGEIHPAWMTISVVRDNNGRVMNYVGVFSDISALKQSQEQLNHLAHHDPLTDLPNRLLFSARLSHAIEHARRNQTHVAVLYLDLDRFKNVNDTLGHPVGDQLLQMVAWRMRERLRECDTVARLGGDEFVVTVDRVEDVTEAATVAQKLLDVFEEPFVVADNELHLGASIGIAIFPQDGNDMATLLKNADAAMYLSKEEGRNTFRFYTTDLSASAEERFHLEVGLRHALERSEFHVFYQPLVDMTTGRIVAAEALLRWQHPEYGLVTPDRFIPLAEDTGLIVPIGEWVIKEACRQFVSWRKQELRLKRVSVNISGVQVQRGNLVGTVGKILHETGIESGCLELEITESQLMKEPEQATATLDGLQALGVELAIDDFGTGYSSLSYLKRFPLDNLKVDKSFVHDIATDANDAAIVRAVIALADNLQLRVTAEGVETEAQRDFLLAHGCKLAQGWLFGRPVPAKEFAQQLLGDATDEADKIA